MRITAKIVDIAELNNRQIRNMYALMNKYYENISWQTFQADLMEKQHMVLIQDSHLDEDEIGGFSTLKTVDLQVENQQVKGIFSGDTIIDKSCRGGVVSQVEFLKYLLSLKRWEYPNEAVYWILISKGYRTYRLIRSYFSKSYPNVFEQTPLFEKALIDNFGSLVYPGCFSADKGVICASRTKDYLKNAQGEITPRKRENPDISYFLDINPGYHRGDELVCVAEVSMQNLTKTGYRLVKRYLEYN
ncbi:MAG: hypothetical protein MJE63_27835 [Proteobacteria bacterium]|nr:hypothetical protein [Pseudomonadota bacterium]